MRITTFYATKKIKILCCPYVLKGKHKKSYLKKCGDVKRLLKLGLFALSAKDQKAKTITYNDLYKKIIRKLYNTFLELICIVNP